MAIPDFQAVMLPFLQLLEDGEPHRLSEVASQLADDFHLTETERSEQLPSGRQSRFLNRVGWARTHLGKAGLLESATPRGIRITARGRALLAEKPTRIDMRVLGRYPEYAAFRGGTATVVPNGGTVIEVPQTPDELMSQAYKQLEATLADDLLAQIKKVSPSFFETLVVDVLTAMGYGGSIEDAARVLGRTGDGGVDGVINEDRLGLDVIYVQAKRWEGSVGRPVVQGFAGSLDGFRARKGVFITTGSFSKDARDFVERIDKRIVLVDGPMLAHLMMQHHVGITVTSTYEIKRIDSDYFLEE